MTQEADYYTTHEAARLLGLSPARVRQMLRAGELEGERGPMLMEGVPGPWRIPAGAVSAYREARQALEAADASETAALPRQEIAPSKLMLGRRMAQLSCCEPYTKYGTWSSVITW